MFTGIVHAAVRIEAVKDMPLGKRLVVDRRSWVSAQGYMPAPSDSIAINGACLTVVEASAELLHFDVIAETLRKTNLGDLCEGDAVNLEPAVTASQPLGGHFMQGHVDGVGVIASIDSGDAECRITITPPAEMLDYIVAKGSIAVDGVSLTIASVGPTEFEVALIPTTLDITTLGQANPGDRVNLEADIITKSVVHVLQRQQASRGEISKETLTKAGFIV